MNRKRKFVAFIWTAIAVFTVLSLSIAMWSRQWVHEQMSSSNKIWSVWGDVALGLIIFTVWILVTTKITNPQQQ